MAEFVNKETLFDPSETFKASQAMPLMRDGFFEPVRQLDGGKPTEDVIIQDNSIAPSSADVRVDTEGKAPADDLQTISLLNTNDGMHLRLWAKDDTRTITLKHSTEHLYGMRLAGGADKPLSTSSYVELKRDGDYWNEIVSDSGVPSGVILLWSGSIATIPSGWALCDGQNGTPNLRNRFVIGAGSSYSPGSSGGSSVTGATTLTIDQIPSHYHNITSRNSQATTGTTVNIGGPGSSGGSTTVVLTDSVGSGASHTHPQNLSPYYALAYIMKL